MRIYLDNDVFQHLKQSASLPLLQKVLADARRNIYCFSEAHLHDLSRDPGEDKFTDMDFMEKIVEDNCYFFNQMTQFEHVTPREYYGSFDWSHRVDAEDLFGFDEIGGIMETMLKSLPLDFKVFLPQEGLPEDVPEEFKELLEKPTTFYEYFHAFMDFTDTLTEDKKRFKAFIQYLHRNSLTAGIYTAMGIEGYDGVNITEKDRLRETYAAYFTKTQKRNLYELFMDMYYGLETFGFIKGKPKRQKMMNLINDSRHAFFGAWCDVVVSKDADFRAKTGFMYHLHDIETKVLSLEEFETALEQWEKDVSLTVVDLIKAASNQQTLSDCIREEKKEDGDMYYFALPSYIPRLFRFDWNIFLYKRGL